MLERGRVVALSLVDDRGSIDYHWVFQIRNWGGLVLHGGEFLLLKWGDFIKSEDVAVASAESAFLDDDEEDCSAWGIPDFGDSANPEWGFDFVVVFHVGSQ